MGFAESTYERIVSDYIGLYPLSYICQQASMHKLVSHFERVVIYCVRNHTFEMHFLKEINNFIQHFNHT